MEADKPLENSMDEVMTDVEQLKVELSAARREFVRIRQVVRSANEALSCAGKASMKDRAVMAAKKILDSEVRTSK